MGSSVSLYIKSASLKAVVLSKRGRVYRVETTGEYGSLEEVGPLQEVYFTLSYPDLVIETVEIPPVEDRETERILIKRQLSQRLGVGEDYLIAYRETEDTSPQTRTYKVFALPTNVVPDKLREDDALKLSELFTTVQFSVAGVSNSVSGDMCIFHAYADEDVLVISVSQGDELLYTRSLSVPPYAKGGGLEDFAYENINMTYVFVAQRSGIPIDVILLSGKLSSSSELTHSLFEITGKGVASPIAYGVFEGIDNITFHEYLPCMGSLFVSQQYDFSPPEVKESRFFRKVLSKVLIPLFLLTLVSLGLLGTRGYQIYTKVHKLERIERDINARMSNMLSDPLLSGQKFEYYNSYIRLLNSARTENPLSILTSVKGLLSLAEGNSLTVAKKGGKVTVSIEVEKSFPSLTGMAIYEERLMKTLESLRQQGVSYKIEGRTKDFQTNRLSLRIVLEKRL